jgi:transposase
MSFHSTAIELEYIPSWFSCFEKAKIFQPLLKTSERIERLCEDASAKYVSRCATRGFSAKKVVWLFVRPFDDLSKKEQEELLAMCQTSTTVEIIYQLVQEFFRLVRSLTGTQLDAWISKVEASGIQELQRFANSLEQDKAAVLAGLTLVHSNGQTEDQITRIKLIKRMMFGRAGFALSVSVFFMLCNSEKLVLCPILVLLYLS